MPTTEMVAADAMNRRASEEKVGESVFIVKRMITPTPEPIKPITIIFWKIFCVCRLCNRIKTRNTTYSMIPTFETWFRRHRSLNHLAPEADKILPLVADAGETGMSRRQLGHALDLDRETVDELLDGLVRAGLLVVTYEDGLPVYRTQTQT